jgi:hypothetical protein
VTTPAADERAAPSPTRALTTIPLIRAQHLRSTSADSSDTAALHDHTYAWTIIDNLTEGTCAFVAGSSNTVNPSVKHASLTESLKVVLHREPTTTAPTDADTASLTVTKHVRPWPTAADRTVVNQGDNPSRSTEAESRSDSDGNDRLHQWGIASFTSISQHLLDRQTESATTQS